MANELLVKSGLQFLFRDSTDFPNSGAGPPTTAANNLIIGTPTQVDIELTSVAASGGARESDKLDLTTPWVELWTVDACVETVVAPIDGGRVEFYWAASPNATAATGNPGGLTGVDAAFTDTTGILGQFQWIGNLLLRNNVINIGHVGVFSPIFQHGILAIVNQGNQAFHTVMDETHIVMTEYIRELQ